MNYLAASYEVCKQRGTKQASGNSPREIKQNFKDNRQERAKQRSIPTRWSGSIKMTKPEGGIPYRLFMIQVSLAGRYAQ
jgi:hypothetical protein